MALQLLNNQRPSPAVLPKRQYARPSEEELMTRVRRTGGISLGIGPGSQARRRKETETMRRARRAAGMVTKMQPRRRSLGGGKERIRPPMVAKTVRCLPVLRCQPKGVGAKKADSNLTFRLPSLF